MSSHRLYRSYALGMKMLAFERSIARFIMHLHLDHPPNASILDVGCGTGVVGLTLMKHRPASTLVATDVNVDLLNRTRRNATDQGIAEERLTLGISDVSQPEVLARMNGSPDSLIRGQFDIVSTGATIGYSRDQEHSINALLRMVKPSGYFLNIEMNEKFWGRNTSRRYRYRMMPLEKMESIIRDNGFQVTRIPVRQFPASLTRIGFIGRRK